MINLHADTHLSTLSLIFYTCILIPILQTKHALARIFTFLLDPHYQPQSIVSQDWELDLPVSRFQDLKLCDECGDDEHDDSEEVCAICLAELEKEEMVNKLPKCGHMFHVECLEKWLDRCQFTCPLCRSSLLRVRSLPCITSKSPFCIDLTHHHD